MEYKDIQKFIKKNPPVDFYPNEDDFDNFEDYQEAYDTEKYNYMKFISSQLDFDSVEDMLDAVNPGNPEDAEYELFEFFYNNMVKDDYFDSYDEYDDYDDDYSGSNNYYSDDYDY